MCYFGESPKIFGESPSIKGEQKKTLAGIWFPLEESKEAGVRESLNFHFLISALESFGESPKIFGEFTNIYKRWTKEKTACWNRVSFEEIERGGPRISKISLSNVSFRVIWKICFFRNFALLFSLLICTKGAFSVYFIVLSFFSWDFILAQTGELLMLDAPENRLKRSGLIEELSQELKCWNSELIYFYL